MEKELINIIQSPQDVCDLLGLSCIETASHWSDLYEDRSTFAAEIDSKEEYEIFESLREKLGIEGEYAELCNRDGEHYSTSSRVYDLEDFQSMCKKHFDGNNYFYKDQELEDESLFYEITEHASDMESIRDLMKRDDDNIEAGYYDCNGILCISQADLDNKDFTGYREDVYSYQFGFKFEYKYKLNSNNDAEAEA